MTITQEVLLHYLRGKRDEIAAILKTYVPDRLSYNETTAKEHKRLEDERDLLEGMIARVMGL